MKILEKTLYRFQKRIFKNSCKFQRETVNIKVVDNNQDYNLS